MGGPVSFKSRDDLVRSLLCCLHLSFVDSEIRDNSQERSRNEQAEPSCRSVFPSEQADQNGYDGADKRHHQDPHGQRKIRVFFTLICSPRRETTQLLKKICCFIISTFTRS